MVPPASTPEELRESTALRIDPGEGGLETCAETPHWLVKLVDITHSNLPIASGFPSPIHLLIMAAITAKVTLLPSVQPLCHSISLSSLFKGVKS